GSVVPGRMPDLFVGAPLCLLGRYRGAERGSLMLRAVDAAGQPYAETVRAAVRTSSALPSIWARGYVRQLEDRYVIGERDLERRIIETSLRFGVLCRFTAFVAVDSVAAVNLGGQLHQVVQPVEAPAGWKVLGRGAMGSVFATTAPAAAA